MSMSEDVESQQHELLALASIYDDDEFHRAGSAQGGEMHIWLELPPDFKIVVKGADSEYNISFLPLLTLNFQLPSEYPSSSSPLFTLSTKWLTRAQMSSLCRRLDELWEENQGCVVLFTWFQFLKEEALDFLGIQSPLEIVKESKVSVQGSSKSSEKEVVEERLRKPSFQLDPRAALTVDPHGDILHQLLDFDEAQRQKVFDGKVFCCTICFTEKLGSVCLCFKECQHVYCKACMTEYFQIQIQDGNVQCLSCPTPKCSSVATPLQVKQLVDEELFARYDRLLLQSTLDQMEDVVYCPRKSCATPVLMEPDRIMGICSTCCYAFCVLCKLAYHALAKCRITADQLRELKDEYLSTSAEGKKLLEKRFGKRAIQKMLEESFSTDWVDENCKSCPHCGVNIQKQEGCNKMTCTSCRKYFCWSCLSQIPNNNPYSHFSNPNSNCYNRLFPGGVDLDEEDALID